MINTLIEKSINIIEGIMITREERTDVFLEILNRVSNVQIGNTIKKHRNINLTRVNDTKFRTESAVLSVKKESTH